MHLPILIGELDVRINSWMLQPATLHRISIQRQALGWSVISVQCACLSHSLEERDEGGGHASVDASIRG